MQMCELNLIRMTPNCKIYLCFCVKGKWWKVWLFTKSKNFRVDYHWQEGLNIKYILHISSFAFIRFTIVNFIFKIILHFNYLTFFIYFFDCIILMIKSDKDMITEALYFWSLWDSFGLMMVTAVEVTTNTFKRRQILWSLYHSSWGRLAPGRCRRC